jgi:hypothetical protein
VEGGAVVVLKVLVLEVLMLEVLVLLDVLELEVLELEVLVLLDVVEVVVVVVGGGAVVVLEVLELEVLVLLDVVEVVVVVVDTSEFMLTVHPRASSVVALLSPAADGPELVPARLTVFPVTSDVTRSARARSTEP